MHAFREAVERADLDAAVALLAEDVVFRSPAVFKPYEGREAVATILRTVFGVFEDFRYTDELDGDGVHGLLFEARVGERSLQGIDLLRPDARRPDRGVHRDDPAGVRAHRARRADGSGAAGRRRGLTADHASNRRSLQSARDRSSGYGTSRRSGS